MKKIEKTIDLTSNFATTPRGEKTIFCFAFVYTPVGNLIVKGRAAEVRQYITKNYKQAVWNYTYWKGKSIFSNGWESTSLYLTFLKHKGHKSNKSHTHYEIRIGKLISTRVGSFTPGKVLNVRRVPRRWIPLYNEAFNV